MKSQIFSRIILYAMIAFLLAACGDLPPTAMLVPEATVTPAVTPINRLPAPTETPLVTATNTPVEPRRRSVFPIFRVSPPYINGILQATLSRLLELLFRRLPIKSRC